MKQSIETKNCFGNVKGNRLTIWICEIEKPNLDRFQKYDNFPQILDQNKFGFYLRFEIWKLLFLPCYEIYQSNSCFYLYLSYLIVNVFPKHLLGIDSFWELKVVDGCNFNNFESFAVTFVSLSPLCYGSRI